MNSGVNDPTPGSTREQVDMSRGIDRLKHRSSAPGTIRNKSIPKKVPRIKYPMAGRIVMFC